MLSKREQYTGESSLNQGDNVSNKSNESEIDKSKHSYHSKDKSLVMSIIG